MCAPVEEPVPSNMYVKSMSYSPIYPLIYKKRVLHVGIYQVMLPAVFSQDPFASFFFTCVRRIVTTRLAPSNQMDFNIIFDDRSNTSHLIIRCSKANAFSSSNRMVENR